MSDDAFGVLCRCARLNAAVARARARLVSARAGVSLAKRDLREKRTTPAKLAEEAIREAAAEDALRDAVAGRRTSRRSPSPSRPWRSCSRHRGPRLRSKAPRNRRIATIDIGPSIAVSNYY